jgi:hypothetical protein
MRTHGNLPGIYGLKGGPFTFPLAMSTWRSLNVRWVQQATYQELFTREWIVDTCKRSFIIDSDEFTGVRTQKYGWISAERETWPSDEEIKECGLCPCATCRLTGKADDILHLGGGIYTPTYMYNHFYAKQVSYFRLILFYIFVSC